MAALPYRLSPLYPFPTSTKSSKTRRPSSGTSQHQHLRYCSPCSISSLPPIAPSSTLPLLLSPSTAARKGPFPTHDHQTIYLAASGWVAPSSYSLNLKSKETAKLQAKARAASKGRVKRAGSSALNASAASSAAGVGVSFGLFSRYNVSEPLPVEIAVANTPIRKQQVNINRAELFAVIRALDKSKTMLSAAVAQRRFGGGVKGFGRRVGVMNATGWENIPVGAQFPAKVEELVILSGSEYVAEGLCNSRKPWRASVEGRRRFGNASSGNSHGALPSPTYNSNQHGRYGSTDTIATSVSSNRSGSSLSSSGSWFKKVPRPKPCDYDLFSEIDFQITELANKYGVKVYVMKVDGVAGAMSMKSGEKGDKEEDVGLKGEMGKMLGSATRMAKEGGEKVAGVGVGGDAA